MTDPAVKRPPTLAGVCVYLGALSAIVSIRAMNMVTSWNGGDRADDVAPALRGLRDAGLSQVEAEDGYKIFLTVLAVLAACGVVFAVYTARGQQVSRIGLTVVVGLSGTATFLGAMGSDFLLAMIGALAVVFSIRLWTGEVRTYFRTLAGHAPPPPKAPRPAKPSKVSAAADPFATPVAAAEQRTVQQAEHPPQGYYAPHPSAPNRPPKSVSTAVWIAFTGSIIVAAVSALGLLVLGLMGSDYERLMSESPLSDRLLDRADMTYDQIYQSSITIFGVCLALSLGGLAASIRVLVKKRSGDVFLFVMTVVTIVASVLFIPIGIPWTIAAIVCLVQLRKPESRAWFSRT